jgi:hypothetical protein
MVFGPTFGDELRAAGLGDGLVWDDAGVRGGEALSPVDRIKLNAVVAAHEPQAQQTAVVEPPLEADEILKLRSLIERLTEQGAL